MEENNGGICFICKRDLQIESFTEVVRGLDTLIQTSLERNDGYSKYLNTVHSVKVHTVCRRKYILKNKGKFAYVNFGPQQSSKFAYSPAKSKVRKTVDSFDFTNLCFLCASKAEQHGKLKYKDKIMFVTRTEFGQNLQNMVKSKKDYFCKNILRRISWTDLLAVEAKYHRSCYQNVINLHNASKKTESTPGRPSNDELDNKLKFVKNR